MRLFWWMLAGSALSALIVTTLLFRESRIAIWLGMLGPLAGALVSWLAMQRVYGKKPEALTGLMIKSFALKMLLFALYVAVVLKSGIVEPFPFAISFMCYYISLHVMEALGLRRLQSAGPTHPPAVNGTE